MVTEIQTQSNLLTMRKLAIVAVAMFGFGFALIPFYQKICEVTGVNNVLKADLVENTQVDATRSVTIEFDSNLSGKLPWTFRPRIRTRPPWLPTRPHSARTGGHCSTIRCSTPSSIIPNTRLRG